MDWQERPQCSSSVAEPFSRSAADVSTDSEVANTRDAVAALHRYSLISRPANGLVSVHRLVQAVTANQMPAELAKTWRRAAAALIEAAIPDDTDLRGNWPTYAELLPHAQPALDLTSPGMWRIAEYLGSSGSYPAARDLSGLYPTPTGTMTVTVLSIHAPSVPAATSLAGPGGGGCGRCARPARRAAARLGAGPRRRAPGHPGRSPQPGLVDRGGGG